MAVTETSLAPLTEKEQSLGKPWRWAEVPDNVGRGCLPLYRGLAGWARPRLQK